MVRLGLVVAQFDKTGEVIDAMAEQAQAAADERDAEVVATVEVPGSYDTPLAADRLARRDDVGAVAVVGAVISGDTGHDEVIADAIAQKLTDVSVERDTPVTLGVIGPDMSAAEARERVDYGALAVESAVDLVKELP